MTFANKNAVYICISLKDAFAPKEIDRQSVCINEDIGAVLQKLIS